MNRPPILYTYAEATGRTAPAMACMQLAEDAGWQVDRYRMLALPDHAGDYHALLASYMRRETFINVEQDVVASLAMLDELADCMWACCTIPYILQQPIESYSVVTGPIVTLDRKPGGQFATLSGLGLVKIGDRYGSEIAAELPGDVPWNVLDQNVSLAMQRLGVMWHVHWTNPLPRHAHPSEMPARNLSSQIVTGRGSS